MICHGAQGLHLALIYRRSSKPAEDRGACLTLKLQRSLSIAADCSWLCSRPRGDGAFSVPGSPTGFCCGCRRSCPVITRFSSKRRLLSKRGRCSLAVNRIGKMVWKICSGMEILSLSSVPLPHSRLAPNSRGWLEEALLTFKDFFLLLFFFCQSGNHIF